jgi:hypothetical protein
MLAVALALLVSGAPAKKPAAATAPAIAVPPPAPSTGRVREVTLDPTKRLEAPEIKLAPALTATLTFPEPWVSAPACGDCQYGDVENKGQYWRLDIDSATNAISLKFIGQPTSAMIDAPPITNVNLQLESGLFVSLVVVLTLDPKSSDLRVDFRLPAGAGGKEKLTAKERELEAGFAGRVADAAAKELLTALMPGTKCRQYAGGPRRNDQMVVRLDQLCSNGRYVYVTFDVQNRQRTDLALLTATLTSQTGATNVEARGDAEVPVVQFEKSSLRFNETSRGIAAIPILDGHLVPSTYTLSVQEDGGAERVVTIEGIEGSGGCNSTGSSLAPSGAIILIVTALRHRRRRELRHERA